MAEFLELEPYVGNPGYEPDTIKPVVVAVDFGTAFSGIAFAYTAAPDDLHLSAPTAKGGELKVPTAVLIKSDGSWSFGNHAVEEYRQAIENHTGPTPPEDHVDVLFFKRYKMELKGQESGFDTLVAKSQNNKPYKLMDLITRSLGFLKDHALEKIKIGFGGAVVGSAYDCKWVLTVPAIWTDFGKAFMRWAAYKAGMVYNEQSNNLVLVLEPEAASLAVKLGSERYDMLLKAAKFIVLDCGGGTVDITAHEVVNERPLKLSTIITPSGGYWGGEYGNVEFFKFLKPPFN